MGNNNGGQSFKEFITYIGRVSRFNSKEDQLYSSLVDFSRGDIEKHNKLLKMIEGYWQKYMNHPEISFLLNEHYKEIFTYYICKIFPFRLDNLAFTGPEVVNLSDFKITFTYGYNQEEIGFIEEIKESLKLKDKTKGILERIFAFVIASFAPIIESVNKKPFAGQFFNLKTRELKTLKKQIEVTIGIVLREQ